MSDKELANRGEKKKAAMSRRDFLRLGATAAAAGVLAGCAVPAAPAPVEEAAAPEAPAVSTGEPKEITLLTWFWQEPGRADAWRKHIQNFHDSQNDIRIKEGGWPFDDYTNRILVQVQAGQIEGEMFTTTPDLSLRLLNANQLEPLEDIIENLGITDLSQAHDSMRRDGHLYGLDIVTVAFGLLYNSAMFEKAGVATPDTVEDWVSITQELTSQPDQFGIYSPHLPSEPEHTWFVLQEWAIPFDGVWAEGQQPVVTSDPVIKGLELFRQMYDCCMPQGTDAATSNRMYAESRIAQMLIVSAAVNVWKTEGPEIYADLRSIIPWPSKKSITRIHPICVNVNADPDGKQAAKTFIEYLYTPDNYKEFIEDCLDVVPAYASGISQDYLDSLHWADGYLSVKPITPPEVMGDFIFYNQEFGKIVLDKFQQVLTADRPVEEDMAEAQIELEALGERVFS